MLGIVGKKVGMTRVFSQAGESIPVTVVEVPANRVSQLKSAKASDGYNALQIVVGTKKSSHVNKAMAGHFAKAGLEGGLCMHEFRVDENLLSDKKIGDEIKVDLFKEGEIVDVRGLTKGKGFAGTVKRHHFSMQDATHGNSLSHRAPGSIGQRQTPGRVFKGKRMSGHMGDVYRTIQNLEVVRIDSGRNLILIRGALPGAPGGFLIITPAVKHIKRA